MNKRTVITDEGLKKLEKELEELKTVRRKEIAERIKTALTFGDLSENSDYDDAKNEQAIVESRINEIENQLKDVHVLDENAISTEMVHIGSRLRVKDCETGEEEKYQIVGSTEANPLGGRISDESPVGKAFLSHKAGDVVEVSTPSGIVKYEIVEIIK
ncbi:MAG: transcription elongation factor GreA [Oscillospiraceae bacterium]|jgi:transcription elongation factor GreA|nr:transcription elongation factor GreA [Oscillospiraceae bacterium]